MARSAGEFRRPPKALVVAQDLPVPLNRRVWAHGLALREAGWDVHVICPAGDLYREDTSPQRVIDGVSVWSYPAAPEWPGPLGALATAVVTWVHTVLLGVRIWRQGRVDVIQVCAPSAAAGPLVGLLRLPPFRVGLVIDVQDLAAERYEQRFGRRGVRRVALAALRFTQRRRLRRARAVIVPNEGVRSLLENRDRVSPEAITVVPPAPDPLTMRRGEADPALRRRRSHLAVFLGVMGPLDGVDQLVLALEHYVWELGRRDLHLALLGFGPELERLRMLALEHRVVEFCEFVGRADALMVETWLSTADVAVVPAPPGTANNLATMPTVLEHLAHELPLVMFDLLENRRAAGDAARIAPEVSAASLAETLADVLDSADERAWRGATGRRRIEGTLGWDRLAPGYVRAMEGALRRPARPPQVGSGHPAHAAHTAPAHPVPAHAVLAHAVPAPAAPIHPVPAHIDGADRAAGTDRTDRAGHGATGEPATGRPLPADTVPATAAVGAGANGAATNGAGSNGAGSNGAGSNGAGSNGAGSNGAEAPAAGIPAPKAPAATAPAAPAARGTSIVPGRNRQRAGSRR